MDRLRQPPESRHKHGYREKWYSRPRGFICMIPFLLFSTVSMAPLSSENGYDVGGTEPTCWDSTVDQDVIKQSALLSNSSSSIQQTNLFTAFDSWLYQSNQSESPVTIRANCYDGMKLDVSIELQEDPDFYVEHNYTVQLAIEIDLARIGSNESSIASLYGDNSTGTVLLRLILCEHSRKGFCHPFVQSESVAAGREERSIIESYTWEDDEDDFTNNLTFSQSQLGGDFITRYVHWHIPISTSNTLSASIDIGIRPPFGDSQSFFFLGHAVIFVTSGDEVMRIDIANTIPEGIITFRTLPVILRVSNTFKWSVVGCSAATASIFMALLAYTIYHRNHSVMKLAQGNFLALMLLCSTISSASLITFLPIRDVFCDLPGILIIYPVTVVSCIMIGRLWRIYSTLIVALDIGKKKKSGLLAGNIMACLGVLAQFHILFQGKFPKPKRASLRVKISEGELLRLIFALSFPQLLLQILGLILHPGEIGLELSAEGRVGRITCTSQSRWIHIAGIMYLGVMFLMNTYIAWLARDLPSLFNEKDKIFTAGSVNALLAFIVLSLLLIADNETTSPNVTSFLFILLFIGSIFTTVWLIIIPKIQKVRRDERVVVSALLAGRSSNSLGSDKTSENTPPAQSTRFDESLAEHDDQVVTNVTTITLKRDDPPPRVVEAQMLYLKETISKISYNSADGLQIPLDDWTLLIERVDAIHTELHRIEFGWSKEDEAAKVQ